MLKELVLKNRSYRGFDPSVRLTREELLELLDLARYTASSVNEQPLRYYIAWEKEEVEQILPLTMWAKALKEMKLPHPAMEPAAFIIICQDMQHQLQHHPVPTGCGRGGSDDAVGRSGKRLRRLHDRKLP